MTHVRLIGPPRITDESGAEREVRGNKPWALLARIVLADHPLSRRQLSSELFPDTVDPLGALRWSLAALRRAFGNADLFTGDPVLHRLPAGVDIDVLALEAGRLDHTTVGEFLEGADPIGGPEFSTWLLVTRQQVAARIAALLHEKVVVALGRGRTAEAVTVAEVAARHSPYDESAQVLLVKSLAAAGRVDAAIGKVDQVRDLFRREFGHEPSDALLSAARTGPAAPSPFVSPAAEAQSLLQAGTSALDAGATDAGVDCLRRAVDAADRAEAPGLRAQCLLALGAALVHQVRGYDDEGTVVLAEAAELAAACDDTATRVHALAEIGYADALAGRRQPAQRRLAAAEALCTGDADLALVIANQAFNLADWGRHDAAIDLYTQALSLARNAGDRRREGWVLTLNAWALLRAGRLAEAGRWADDAVALLHDMRWVSFEPFAVAVQHELALISGHDPGRTRLERNFAMSCQLRDPCWEGCSARLLALHHAAEGDLGAALQWIGEAHTSASRHTDAWAAAIGEILLSEATLRALAGDATGADAAAREAVAFAARAQLDDLLRRSLLVLQH